MLSNLRKLIYYRQHPDAALRYLPIVNLIKKRGWENSRILEVGSGSYGITPYIKKAVTGVDQEFNEPAVPWLRQVKGSAAALPSDDNSFDLVIISDVLEHLPLKIRKAALDEAIRVAKTAVIVSGPFGKEAAEQDKYLADYSLKTTGRMHPFFIDHLKLGLPEIADIVEMASQNRNVKSVEKIGQYLNLRVREKLMKLFISNNKLSYYFYLKGLLPLVPLLSKMNKPPFYRQVVLITL